MTRKPWLALAIPACAALLHGASAADDSQRLREQVAYLASPELDGRLTGTEGATRAADYLVERLRELGARPLPGRDDFRLPFEFAAAKRDAGTSLTLVDGAGNPRRWSGSEVVRALAFSETATVSGPLVFAGYGLVVPEGQGLGYDSFRGLDVKGKIVVVLRGFPAGADARTRATLARYAELRDKARTARDLGAVAMLAVGDQPSPGAGGTLPMTPDAALAGPGLAAAGLGPEPTQAIFAHAGHDGLEAIQRSLDSGNPHVTGFEIQGLTLTLDVKVERERRSAVNVAGYLPAAAGDAAAASARQYVILGAHYDHLGRGGHGGSPARDGEAGRVHPGADDNASGVVAVLEAGRQLSGSALTRPVVLAFWGGAEQGLLGSSVFAGGGGLDAGHIVAYLDLDMVGRLRDNRLTLQSAGTSSVWPGLVERTNVMAGLNIDLQADPYLPADSIAFVRAGVPALGFYTGGHEDYHRPTDTAGALNYEGLQRVASFAASLARKLTKLDERPDFKTVARDSRDDAGRENARPFTGTVPDYAAEVEGLRLSAVVAGGPAEAAGLAGGDVIVEFAGHAITNVYDYSDALEGVKVGQPIKVVFLRDGARSEVEIVPTGRH